MAKRPPPLRDLYPRITAFPTLLGAFRKASKGKRYRPDVLAFGANLEADLFQLQHELRSFIYAPGSYRQFMVHEPKPRWVSAAPFRDRVVHHALIGVIAPPLERHFIPTSYANRKGYGTHRALRRFHRACREHAWVLQADIRLYFPSIDHRLRALPGIRACLRHVDDVALFADRPDPLQQALVVLRADLAELRLRPPRAGAPTSPMATRSSFAADSSRATARPTSTPTTAFAPAVSSPQHPSPSEPLEGIPAGALEGSRPAPVITGPAGESAQEPQTPRGRMTWLVRWAFLSLPRLTTGLPRNKCTRPGKK